MKGCYQGMYKDNNEIDHGVKREARKKFEKYFPQNDTKVYPGNAFGYLEGESNKVTDYLILTSVK